MDFDNHLAGFAAGGASNLEAGLAAASIGSPDLTLVVTDGVANASSAAPDAAVHLAATEQTVEEAQQPDSDDGTARQ